MVMTIEGIKRGGGLSVQPRYKRFGEGQNEGCFFPRPFQLLDVKAGLLIVTEIKQKPVAVTAHSFTIVPTIIIKPSRFDASPLTMCSVR